MKEAECQRRVSKQQPSMFKHASPHWQTLVTIGNHSSFKGKLAQFGVPNFIAQLGLTTERVFSRREFSIGDFRSFKNTFAKHEPGFVQRMLLFCPIPIPSRPHLFGFLSLHGGSAAHEIHALLLSGKIQQGILGSAPRLVHCTYNTLAEPHRRQSWPETWAKGSFPWAKGSFPEVQCFRKGFLRFVWLTAYSSACELFQWTAGPESSTCEKKNMHVHTMWGPQDS